MQLFNRGDFEAVISSFKTAKKIIRKLDYEYNQKKQLFSFLKNLIFSKGIIAVNNIKFGFGNLEEFQRSKTLLTKELKTIKWIDTFFSKGDIFYDIGANIGTYSLYTAKRGIKKVLAFEPHFKNYNRLCNNIFINNLCDKILAYCVALSDNIEMGSLYHYKFTSGSSTSQFNRNVDHLGNTFEPKFLQGIVGLSLDYFVSKSPVEYFPNHIKIDVDGLEIEIINGITCILRDKRLKSLLVEVTFDDLYITRTILRQDFKVWDKEITGKETKNIIFYRSS